ncbi:MAG: hypothetical protein AABO58_15200 [Acidobacteriota bacterium]
MSDAMAVPASGDDRTAARNFVERFLEKYFPTLPAWLRSIIYFMMFMLFAYSFLRLIGGDFAVRGQVFKGSSLVKNSFDVCIGEGRYGTNSVGDFYAVLPPSQYYGMLITGKAHVDVFQGSERVHQQDVRFSRFPPRFAEIIIQTAQAPLPPDRAARFDWSLVPSAFAQTRAAATERLYIERIALSDVDAREADATLSAGSTRYPLLLDGRTGSRIPLLRGKELDLGSRFYFAIPSTLTGRIVTVTISPKGLFAGAQTFKFAMPPLNQTATSTGGRSEASWCGTGRSFPPPPRRLAADGGRLTAGERPTECRTQNEHPAFPVLHSSFCIRHSYSRLRPPQTPNHSSSWATSPAAARM